MMSFFQRCEGSACVLVSNGVYKQVDVYVRDGFLYAATAGGFVRLRADGSTSKAKMRLEFIDFDEDLCEDRLGRLCQKHVRGAVALPGQAAQKLLGGPTDG